MPFASDGQTEISVSETGPKVMLTVRDPGHPVFHYGLLPPAAAALGRELLSASGQTDPACGLADAARHLLAVLTSPDEIVRDTQIDRAVRATEVALERLKGATADA